MIFVLTCWCSQFWQNTESTKLPLPITFKKKKTSKELQAWFHERTGKETSTDTLTFLGGYLTFFKKKFENHDCITEPRILACWELWWWSAVKDAGLKFGCSFSNNPTPKQQSSKKKWVHKEDLRTLLFFYTCVIFILLLCLGSW